MLPVNPIKVVIADDHPFVRIGIRKILESAPGFEVIGEAQNGQEALQLATELLPDVLLLDIQMPILDGIQVLDILGKMGLNISIIILSAYNNKFFAYETITKGAKGYLIKDEAPYVMLDAIRNCVVQDRIYISQEISV